MSPARRRIRGSVVAESSSRFSGTVGGLWPRSYARTLLKSSRWIRGLPGTVVGKVEVSHLLCYDAVPGKGKARLPRPTSGRYLLPRAYSGRGRGKGGVDLKIFKEGEGNGKKGNIWENVSAS